MAKGPSATPLTFTTSASSQVAHGLWGSATLCLHSRHPGCGNLQAGPNKTSTCRKCHSPAVTCHVSSPAPRRPLSLCSKPLSLHPRLEITNPPVSWRGWMVPGRKGTQGNRLSTSPVRRAHSPGSYLGSSSGESLLGRHQCGFFHHRSRRGISVSCWKPEGSLRLLLLIPWREGTARTSQRVSRRISRADSNTVNPVSLGREVTSQVPWYSYIAITNGFLVSRTRRRLTQHPCTGCLGLPQRMPLTCDLKQQKCFLSLFWRPGVLGGMYPLGLDQPKVSAGP